MKSRGGQRILVRAAVDVGSRQLFGRGVGDRSDGDIGLGDTADVAEVARYTEVRQQDSAIIRLSGWVSRMLAGLTSRCSRPRSWA